MAAADRLPGMLKTVLIYGLALAAGAVALQWLEYQIWARAHAGTIYVALIAAAFMGLGIWVGARLFRRESRARSRQSISLREAHCRRSTAAWIRPNCGEKSENTSPVSSASRKKPSASHGP